MSVVVFVHENGCICLYVVPVWSDLHKLWSAITQCINHRAWQKYNDLSGGSLHIIMEYYVFSFQMIYFVVLDLRPTNEYLISGPKIYSYV